MTQPANPLQVTTPSDREIVMIRAFDAPRDLVFEAWTQPEHVRHWWGPRSSTILVCKAEVRPAAGATSPLRATEARCPSPASTER